MREKLFAGNARLCEIHGIEDRVDLLFREELFLQYELPDALSGDDGALGDVRGVLIADVRA